MTVSLHAIMDKNFFIFCKNLTYLDGILYSLV